MTKQDKARRRHDGGTGTFRGGAPTRAARGEVNVVFSFQIQSSKKNFRYLHEDLNLDEIKNTLHSLAVNREMNLMNLIRP